ncbi:MAG: hypothetical protein ACYS8X_12975 [Planctomycetota bacterium]|jgi:hypothetical protein
MAEIRQQIIAEVHDEPGKLSELTDRLKYAGVSIQAICGWSERGRGHVMFLVDDNDKAVQAIEPVVDHVRFEDVVCVMTPNRPGALSDVAHKIGDMGIFINAIYAAPDEGADSLIILSTDNNARAAELI